NYEQLAPREAPKAKEAASPSSDDPFEGTGRKLTVKAGGAADLKLTVKGSVATGVYTYVTYLSDKPDADQQIEIWP
ncbi:MAG TPA: hypothetical protein VFF12_03620, partial [Myxococcaceae bacterium]|nr:hypothetical protein [Myxococcaceae bacterium]